MEKENLNFLSFPSDKDKLIFEGTYYFKLQFAPNFKFNDMDEQLATLRTNEVALDPYGIKQKVAEFVTNRLFTEGGNIVSFTGQQQAFKAQVSGAITSAANAVVNQYTSALQQFLTEDATKKPRTMDLLYTASNPMEKAIVFLPLNSLRIERKSGVYQTQGVYSSVQQAVASKERQTMESSTQVSGAMTARGLSENPFLGHTMSAVDFESYNLEWELMPKNEDEMASLIQILTYFQGACLSNLNLNNRNNVKWILPPICEMGILVSSLTNTYGQVEMNNRTWKLQDLIDARNTDIQKQTQFSEIGNIEADSVKSFWLKPPVNVFISNITIEPLENKGGVLLSPEGFPMGVKLNVTLIRTALSTIDDLFRGDNRINMSETEKNGGNKDMKRANPFS